MADDTSCVRRLLLEISARCEKVREAAEGYHSGRSHEVRRGRGNPRRGSGAEVLTEGSGPPIKVQGAIPAPL
jgi:hypothetical protein